MEQNLSITLHDHVLKSLIERKLMEEPHILLHWSIFIILLINLLNFNYVVAEDHQVGDEEGWTQSFNYLRWSESHNFTVGDVLVFTYVKSQHNVYEVTEDTYRSCVRSSGVITTYDSGNDRIRLIEAKKYFFICNISGHCIGGMKVEVDVKETAAAPSPGHDEDNGGTNNHPNSKNGVRSHRWEGTWACSLLAVVVSVLLNH